MIRRFLACAALQAALQAVLLLGGCAAPTKGIEPASAPFGDAYYLATCAACDTLLGTRGEALDVVHRRRSLRLCTQACADRLHSDPDAVHAFADARMKADQRPHYPLTTSIVSEAPLPPEPVDVVVGNRLFRVATPDEVPKLLRDSAAAFRRLDQAVRTAQTPTYAMKGKCPVQGDILPSDTIIDLVVANRMIRVCCRRCEVVVRARPYQYLGMDDYANRSSGGQP